MSKKRQRKYSHIATKKSWPEEIQYGQIIEKEINVLFSTQIIMKKFNSALGHNYVIIQNFKNNF